MYLQDKLSTVRSMGEALLAVNFYNLETLQAILQAFSTKGRPVILQLSEASIHYMGIEIAVAMARKAMECFQVEAWLHLDHGHTIELVRKCLDAGFDSVMIDASEMPFKENIRITAEAVKIASGYNASVEAELGYVAKLGQKHANRFTQPEEAKVFVEETGVHSLAVAIGSAHGFYSDPPNLQMELLGRIRQAVPVALVLHGGSGIPGDQLREAIRRGISKVNLATETKDTFMKTLREVLKENDEIDLRRIFPIATKAVKELIANKIEIVSLA